MAATAPLLTDVEARTSINAAPSPSTRVSRGSSFQFAVRQASHAFGSAHVVLLIMAVELLAVGYLVVTGAKGTSWVTAQPELLNDDLPLIKLKNIWLVLRVGSMPLVNAAIVWVILVHGMETIVRNTDLDKADAHMKLVASGKKWSSLDILSTTVTLLLNLMVWNGATTNGFTSSGVSGYYFGLAAFASVFMVVSTTTCMHALRVALLRVHGPAIPAHLTKLRPRIYGLFWMCFISLAYTIVISVNSPPFATSVTLVTEANPNPQHAPCRMAQNATYIQTYCAPDPKAERYPWMICTDGGYEEYRSAQAACFAANAYFSTAAKAYACTFLSVFLITFWFWQEIAAAGSGVAPVLPRVRMLADAVLMLSHGVSLPIFIAVVLAPQPLLRNNYFASWVYNLELVIFSVSGLSTGAVLHQFEGILQALGALVAGDDMKTSDKFGKKSTVRTELEGILGPSDTASKKTLTETLRELCACCCDFPCFRRRTAPSARTSVGWGSSTGDVEAGASGSSRSDKYTNKPTDLIMGKAKDAALGIDYYMRVGSDFASASESRREPT